MWLTVCVCVIVGLPHHLGHGGYDARLLAEPIRHLDRVLDPLDGLLDVRGVKGHDGLEVADGAVAQGVVDAGVGPGARRERERKNKNRQRER